MTFSPQARLPPLLFYILFGIWNSRWLKCLEIPKAGFSTQVTRGCLYTHPGFVTIWSYRKWGLMGVSRFCWQRSFKRIPGTQCQGRLQSTVVHTKQVFVEWINERVKRGHLLIVTDGITEADGGTAGASCCWPPNDPHLACLIKNSIFSAVCILLGVPGFSRGYADAHGFKGMGFCFCF